MYALRPALSVPSLCQSHNTNPVKVETEANSSIHYILCPTTHTCFSYLNTGVTNCTRGHKFQLLLTFHWFVHTCYSFIWSVAGMGMPFLPLYGWTWDSGGTGRDRDTSLFWAPDCTSCLQCSGDPEVRWCKWVRLGETVKSKMADLNMRAFTTCSFRTMFPKKSSVPFSFLASLIILNGHK